MKSKSLLKITNNIYKFKTKAKMGIQKIEMYTCVCDNCGKSADEDSDYSCWGDSSIAKDIAVNCNLAVEGGKDYCTDCFEYDDEDNLILKNQKP